MVIDFFLKLFKIKVFGKLQIGNTTLEVAFPLL